MWEDNFEEALDIHQKIRGLITRNEEDYVRWLTAGTTPSDPCSPEFALDKVIPLREERTVLEHAEKESLSTLIPFQDFLRERGLEEILAEVEHQEIEEIFDDMYGTPPPRKSFKHSKSLSPLETLNRFVELDEAIRKLEIQSREETKLIRQKGLINISV
jgi:hypothetical protein